VRSLCPRALVLEKGRLAFDGGTDDAVHRYLGHVGDAGDAVAEADALRLHVVKERLYSDEPFFECTRVSVLDEDGIPCATFRSDEPITIAVEYRVHRQVPALRVLVTLTDENQAPVLRTETIDDASGGGLLRLEPGAYRSTVTLPRYLFGDTELDLNVSLIAEVNQVVDYAALVGIEIRFAGHGANMRGNAILRPQLDWQTGTAEERSSTERATSSSA